MRNTQKRLCTKPITRYITAFLIIFFGMGFVHTIQAQYYASIEKRIINNGFYPVQQYSTVIPALQQTISVKAQDQPIKTVLHQITQKANLGIAYNTHLPVLNRQVTITQNKISVADALQQILKETNYRAAISKTKEIVLIKQLPPNLNTLNQVEQTISGTVTDAETGQPLIGANVYVVGANLGTATDQNGQYSLTLPDDVDSLRFTYIGYKSQSVAINGRNVINVQLVPKVNRFNELVVTALGITRQERSIGYSTQSVEGENLSVTNDMNVLGSLAGKVSGVLVRGSSGASMGGTSNIQIRGVSSLTASGAGKPLIVVNGTPISNANFSGRAGADFGNLAQDINPNAIKSVTVLKGPAATALYGIRGQNGVILYTTKDGSGVDEFTVEINTGFSIQQTHSFPEFQNKYGGGYNQAFDTLANDQLVVMTRADESWGPRLKGQMVRKYFSFYPNDPMYGQESPWVAHPNNIKNFYETGLTANLGLTVSGGEENYNFRLSFNHADINGVYPNAKLGRTNLGLSASVDVGERWTFSTDLSYATNDGMRPVIHSGQGRSFKTWFQRQLNMERLKTHVNQMWNLPKPNLQTGEMEDFTPLYWSNPYWDAYKNTTHDYRDRIFGNIGVVFDVLPGLSISGYIRGDMFIQNIESKTHDGGGLIPDYSFNKYQNVEMNYELKAQFTQDWEDFSLDATIGTNLFHRKYSELQQSTVGGLITPGYFNIAASQDRPDVSSYKLQKKILSGYGLLTLGYKDTYFLSASMRGDKTSTLPEDHNTYWYPSVSGSFVFSELVDWQPLSFGKLRLSYAQAGSDLDPYKTTQTLEVGGVYSGLKTIFIPNEINNPNIKPTISTAYEAGVDLNFWGRLGIHATYYFQRSENQIITLNVSGTSGYRSAVVNAGLIENKGVEISLTGTPIQTQDFTWNANFNISKNVNKVVKLHPDIDVYVHEVTVYSGVPSYLSSFAGGPFGVLVGTGFQRDPETGKILIGEDGMPLYTQADQRFGTVLPDFVGGFRNVFHYKNWSLSTMISFQMGGQFFSRSLLLSRKTGVAKITAAVNDKGNNVRDPVGQGGGVKISGISAESGEPITTYVNAHDYYNNILGNSVFEWTVVDASYIKLSEVNLSYNFGTDILQYLPVQNITVSVYARNPIMIWQEAPQGINPSIFTSGSQPIPWYESSQLPSVRTFGFNLNITF